MNLEEAKKIEAEELYLLRKQLIALGIPPQSIVVPYRHGHDFECDLAVLNEDRKLPSMCFEIRAFKVDKAFKSTCRALAAGLSCYAVVFDGKTRRTLIALLRKGDPLIPFGEWLDLSDTEKVRQLIPEYMTASRIVDNLVTEKTQGQRIRVVSGLKTFACRVYLPISAALALAHLFVPITWQHLSLYGMATLVMFAVFGAKFVFQCKGLNILLDVSHESCKSEK